MKKLRNHHIPQVLIILGLLTLLLSGCTIRLVADYDAETEKAIFETAKKVDLFYVQLLDTPEDQRQYAAFADSYMTIEADLDSLLLRNKVRPKNEDSIEIVSTTLDLWVKYKNRHQQTNTYTTGNAELDRDKFDRLFSYMARAEKAKPNITE